MKPIKTNEKSTASDSANTSGTKARKNKEVILPFSTVSISKWNRSFAAKPDGDYIKKLAADIKHNDLLHPLTLVVSKSGKTAHAVLAGANRLWALINLRGDASGLMEGEYVIRDGLTEEDPRCLDISLSENDHRRQPSVIETARYVDRLLKEEHVDQTKLAPKLHLGRKVVNRLSRLARCFEQLPETWQSDLSKSPSQEDQKVPVITLSHWEEVAGAIDDNAIIPSVKDVLESAAKEHWSTRDLRKALVKAADPNAAKTPGDPSDESDQTQPGTTDPKKRVVSPLHMVEKALESILAASEAIKNAMPVEAKILSDVAAKVEKVLNLVEAMSNKGDSEKQDKKPKAA